jgi:hypothetical protein
VGVVDVVGMPGFWLAGFDVAGTGAAGIAGALGDVAGVVKGGATIESSLEELMPVPQARQSGMLHSQGRAPNEPFIDH